MYDFKIQCSSSDCGKITDAGDVNDLIYKCRDSKDGWIRCRSCGERGFINKWTLAGRRGRHDSDGFWYLKAIIKLHRLPPSVD